MFRVIRSKVREVDPILAEEVDPIGVIMAATIGGYPIIILVC